jgi:hypothetical protein
MTQTRKEALIELRDKVTVGAWDSAEAAAIFALDQDEIEQAFGHALTSQMYRGYHAYAGSLDAAEVLHEAVLPGWVYNIAPGFAHVIPPHDNGDQEAHTGLSETVARAWLLAVLEALIAQEPDT